MGLTNGCFDLLHPGHVELLKRARAGCDRLVVALNTDASVRRLKGERRPVQNEHARSIVMAAIDSVDLVTQFEEDTPLQLIDLLKPDYLIKGADYTSQQSSARIWSAHMEARSFWFRSNGAPARHRSSRAPAPGRHDADWMTSLCRRESGAISPVAKRRRPDARREASALRPLRAGPD